MKKTAILIVLLIGLGMSCFGQMAGKTNDSVVQMHPDANTVYKDENGNTITMEQFGGYIMQQDVYTAIPEIENGKIISLQVQKKAKSDAPAIAEGDVAPGFKGVLLDGTPVSLAQLKGKIIVLNFWFIACHPCAMEMPELNELTKKYSNDNDVVFLAITFDTKDQVKKFLSKTKFSYKQVAGAKDICDAYQVPFYPTHIVIDKAGKVYHMQGGYMPGTGQQLDSIIQDIKNNKALQPKAKTAVTGESKISFDASSIIEDENGNRLDINKAAEMINSGNYQPDTVQRDGKNILILKKKQ